jgi:hypothetical protein
MIILEVDVLLAFVEIVKITIPALIVFFVAYKLISQLLDDNKHSRLMQLKKEHSQQITPIKLQAYERITLFLDRISPDNLVLRHSRSGQTAAQLRKTLVQSITDEFNHNISQQIYLSDQSWKMIRNVKESVIAIVEVCYQECNEGDSGPALGKRILTRLMNEKEIPTQRAIELLKKEIEIVF